MYQQQHSLPPKYGSGAESWQTADGLLSRVVANGRALARRGRHQGDEGIVTLAMVASLAFYYVVPSPLLSLPGMLCFAVLAWLRLDLALCLLPLTFPFWYVPKRVFGHVVFPLSEVALAVCVGVALLGAAMWLVREDSHGEGRARMAMSEGQAIAQAIARELGPWLLAGAALLVIGTGLGVVIARRPHEALRAWRWEVVEPLLYLGLVAIHVRARRMARWLVWSLLGSALLVAVLATVQVLWLHVTFASLAQGNAVIPYGTATGEAQRATAFIYGSGNSLGAWLARALPLTLALALVPGGVGSTPSFRRERLAAALCGIAYLPVLYWSASRGAWVAAGLACVVMACVAWRRAWPAVAVAGAGLVAAVWRRGPLADWVIGGHGGTAEVRLLIWQAAWHMIRDHPLLGIGPDQFLYYYSNLYTSHPYWIAVLNGHRTAAVNEPQIAQPHNLLLDLWLSGGLLAIVGFVMALALLWRRCWRIWRAAGSRASAALDRWYAGAALGVGGAALAGVLHGMVDNGYFAPDLALAFWWAVAVVVVVERKIMN